MEELAKLYSPFIKAQNEKPFHFEKIPGAQTTLKAYNPICGDRFDIYIDNQQGTYFHGFGCAISKASSSVMAKALSGKSNSEALTHCIEFMDFMDKKIDASQLTLGTDFIAFAGVHDFPERYDCVTLSWKAMKKFLETQEVKR